MQLPENLISLPPHVTLVAVSKNQSDAKIDAALGLGLRHFGENRVQEATRHWHERRALYPDLTLHLIGPLQSNKTADAVALFDVIHTIDREKIAHALSMEMIKQQRHLPCFIQVNQGCEPQKAGILPNEVADFVHLCRDVLHLKVQGLMTIPPLDADPVPYFNALRALAEQHTLPHLSMGMSDDYMDAINAGATFIRVGSALFGAR
jgi:hypothetical protein